MKTPQQINQLLDDCLLQISGESGYTLNDTELKGYIDLQDLSRLEKIQFATLVTKEMCNVSAVSVENSKLMRIFEIIKI